MNCEDARRHWNLYHDSEGESELYFQINEHLAECPDCAEWFHRQSRLEELVVERLRPKGPTPELWDSVLAGAGLEKRPAGTRRWFFFGSLAALAVCLLIAVTLWPLPDAESPDLAELTAEQHERLSEGRAPLEFASRSDLEVEGYLRRKVSFPVRCPPRKDTGFIVRGAGVSRLEGETVAYVFGRVAGRPVSVFILSGESLRRFPHQFEAVRREGVHRCREGDNEMVMARIDRNAVLVTGSVDSQRLLRVLNAYGSYPHHNG